MVLSIQNSQEYQMDSQWNLHEFNKAEFQGVIKKIHVGQSEARRNVLENTWQGRFRKI